MTNPILAQFTHSREEFPGEEPIDTYALASEFVESAHTISVDSTGPRIMLVDAPSGSFDLPQLAQFASEVQRCLLAAEHLEADRTESAVVDLRAAQVPDPLARFDYALQAADMPGDDDVEVYSLASEISWVGSHDVQRAASEPGWRIAPADMPHGSLGVGEAAIYVAELQRCITACAHLNAREVAA